MASCSLDYEIGILKKYTDEKVVATVDDDTIDSLSMRGHISMGYSFFHERRTAKTTHSGRLLAGITDE
jgi:hypothetical protein